jgi:adenylylsulfate kinase
MIMWLVGLSGAGKSTLAEQVVAETRKRLSNIVLVDGDIMREVWGDNLGHTLEGRRANANRLCRLGSYLESQNIHAVCAILSLFEETRDWNRVNLQNYYEVYLKTPLADMAKRDIKGFYRLANNNEIELPGINMIFQEPSQPNEVIENNQELEYLVKQAPRLSALFN